MIKSELAQTNASVTPVQRMIFPSNIAQHQLEQHGLPNGGVDAVSYTLLAQRDALSLADQCLVDPETGELVAGAAVVSGAVTSGPLRPTVNYLPDPAGRAVALSGLPGANAPVSIAFGTWPTYRGAMLGLRAGTVAPTVKAANQSVSVQLAKATQAIVTVSAGLDSTLLSHFRWFQAMSPDEQAAATANVVAGGSAIFSPTQTLLLVHAVRLPLLPPSFTAGAVTASRTDVGQTATLLAGTINCHGASTEHLTVRSQWTDPVDDVTVSAPGQLSRRAVVGDVQALGTGVDSLAGPSIDLGNTKRHVVTIDAEAFCSFSRYFTERRDTSAVVGTPILLNANGVAASSVVVTDRTTGQRFIEGTDDASNATAGTITVLAPAGIVDGSPIRIEFIPLPVSRRSAEAAVGSRTASFTVSASARPAAPVVAHILPAFARTTSATATVLTVKHDGRVLRVFLERPWYSSGVGELLGVAIDAAAVTNRVLTRWGRDPLAPGPGATVDPTTSSFTSGTATAALIDGLFDVAGHDVVFDAERGLWTCDIAISETFRYRPFVQLALCRYQPGAIPGEHVSDTVMPDAVRLGALRLGALRTVTVTRATGGRATVRVTGQDDTNSMQVTLHQADAAISDPELRWTSMGAAQTLTRTGTRTASVHTRTISVAPTGTTRRLLIEDREPVKHQVGNVLQNQFDVVYRETVEIPSTW